MTQQRIWLVFAAIAGIGFGVQVSLPTDFTNWPETTFDTAPRGHAGVFALLDRFDATPGRWLSGVTQPAATDTIWWIAPKGACEGVPEDEPSKSGDGAAPATPFEMTTRPWIEAGGTAIVWLAHPPLPKAPSSIGALEPEDPDGDEQAVKVDSSRAKESASKSKSDEGEDENDAQSVREEWAEQLARQRRETREGVARECEAILGIPLPPRELAELEGGLPPEQGRYSPIVFSVGRATARREDFDYDETRTLPGGTLAFFQSVQSASKGVVTQEEAGGDEVGGDESANGKSMGTSWKALWVEADERRPLALERKLGEGRLIVIADARIVSNDRLGHVDSAPFVFDWVRDEGRPWIDEHAHGVVPENGTFRYLAGSPAWAAGLGLLVLGLLVVWRGNAWPTRSVAEFDPDSPTLSTFVDSVARLYSGSHDYAQVFDRYRLLSLDRIRRAQGLPPGTEVEVILASLRARVENWPPLEEAGLRHLLIRQASISSASDLARNIARLDDLVRVVRDHGKRSGNQSDQAEIQQRQHRSKGDS